jgi:hypothetical protein
MPEEYEDVTEKARELVHEQHAEAGHAELRPRWLEFLAVSTALFAVLAAVASLLAGDSANEALYKSNLATLSQAKASDTWSEFQADSLKKYLQTTYAETLMLLGAPPEQIKAARQEAKRRQSLQNGLKEEAQRQDGETKALLEESRQLLERHRVFALGVTLFQVAIGLSAIAALLRLRWVWWVSLLAGGLALVQLLRGLAHA